MTGVMNYKVAILIDDMIDTGNTLELATRALNEAGAKKIYAIVSHGARYLPLLILFKLIILICA